ncbi:hypothetical protein RMATCC62417_14946 [Rhizopus microsporus]|nr:hypothetical protein RMATCC62417_14946 [Rhizopus microsporus]
MRKRLHSLSSSESSTSSIWNRVRQLFHFYSTEPSLSSSTTTHSETDSGYWMNGYLPDRKVKRLCCRRYRRHSGSREQDEQQTPTVSFHLPPFSPTYARTDAFPYSNFYYRLPNGKWMIRYRSGTRDILGTDEIEGYMI